MTAFDFLTESPTARLPSGSPLDLLPPRQRIIWLARAARVSMTDIAKVLRLSREMVYRDLREAWATLKRAVPGGATYLDRPQDDQGEE